MILSFILNFIILVFICVAQFIKVTFNFIWPLLIVVVAYIFIKSYHHFKVFGINDFSDFKKRKNINMRKELIKNIFKKLPSYKKYVSLNYLKSDYLMVDSSGINLILITNYEDQIIGSINDQYLTNKLRNVENVKIDNFFKHLDRDYEIISKKTNAKINKYLIINNNCSIDFFYSDEFKVVRLKDVYFALEKQQKNNKIYGKEEIDKIFNLF